MPWYGCELLGEDWTLFVKAENSQEAKKSFYRVALQEGWIERDDYIYIRCRREKHIDPEVLERYLDEVISRPPHCKRCGLYLIPPGRKCPVCEEE